MLENQGIVSGECLEVCGRDVVHQDACEMPLRDQAVVECSPDIAQGEQRFGVAVLLQQDIVHGWQSILQVPERTDVPLDPLPDLDDGSRSFNRVATSAV